MTLRKKRDNDEVTSAISMRLLVRYSTLASATWVEDTKLPVCTESGLMTPENRTNSMPLSSETCFSPLTTRLPFSSTSTTVTPMVPVKLLLELTAPASAYLSALEALAPNWEILLLKKLGTAAVTEAVLLPE